MDWVIAGFDRCLRHVHPDDLEAAEDVAGFRLCRREPGCRQYAISWSWPPGCKNHLSGTRRALEYRRYRLDLIEDRRAQLMGAWLAYQAGDRSHRVLHQLDLCEHAVQRLADQLVAEADA